jgi:peptidoglycan/LPS O-acetylase OafA/YrhL
MSSVSSSERFPVLDGLRAISILLVLACHLLPLGPKALRLNETAGAMGMSLFFGLSGFLITSGLIRNPNIHEFMARRLTRILPLAYVYTIFVFVVVSFDPKALLWTNLFVVNYLPEYWHPLTAHFWSLDVEMQFYFAIAVVVAAAGPRGLWLVWPACLAVTLLRINAGAYIAGETHLRVDEILSGACIATLYSSGIRLKSFQALMTTAALLWAISAWPFSGPLQYVRPYAAALLLFATLHYGAAKPRTLLTSRPMQYVARISYALYVFHPLTAFGWMNEGSTLIKYALKRPISFILTFLLAHISTFYWERPWQMAAKRWVQKRRAGLSAGIAAAPTKPSP